MTEVDKDTDKQLKQLFGACDRKGKGYVVKEELEELCFSLGISVEDSDVIFSDLDLDNDGQITFSDFSSGFKEFLSPENDEILVHEPGRRRPSMWTFTSELKQDKTYKPRDDDNETYANSDEAWSVDMDDSMERRKKESIYVAWTNFTSSLVDCNLLSLSSDSQHQIRQLYKELQRRNFPPSIATKVDSAVSSLMKEMGKLQKENRTLEELYNKEKTTHVKTLMTLEDEIEDQVAKVEEKARERANIEKEAEKRQLQQQMDQEVAEMQAHLKIFQKVDKWLQNEHKPDEAQDARKKLAESNIVNRELRLALDDTTSNLALFRAELAHCRLQYEEKCLELHQEREQVLEYIHQYDHLRRQLDLIHEANKRLQDTNDSLRQFVEVDVRTSSQRSFYKRNICKSRSLSPISSSAVVENESNNISLGAICLLDDLDSGLSTLAERTEDFSGRGNESFTFTTEPTSLEEELRNLPEMTIYETFNRVNQKSSLKDESSLSTSTLNNIPYIKNFTIPPPPADFPSTPRRVSPKEGEASLSSSSGNIEESSFTPDRTYKVVLAGDTAVGKSTFIARICKGEFVPHMAATLGVDYKVKTVKVDNKNMVIQLWDTAGQERYRSITKCYFRRADGVLLLYDVTNEKSFRHIRQWVQDINESCVGSIPLLLCGNKIDIRGKNIKLNNNMITHCAGERVAQENGAQYFETSTKNGDNIMEAFIELARQMAACEDLAIRTSALRLISGGKKKRSCCNSGKKDL